MLAGVAWIAFSTLFACLVSVLVCRACQRAAQRALQSPSPPPLERPPPISILRPLCGLDDALYDNLVSLAEQDYPAFEIVLGFADAADPALALAQRLRANYPERAIRIVCDPRSRGHNPKVANLENMLPLARYEHLLISDSNVVLERDFLWRVASELSSPETGLVVNPVVGVGERTLCAMLENLHLNSSVLATLCGARALLRHTCAIGKSMLFTRAALEAAGGLAGVRDVLAEDYVLGQRFEAAGYRVALCNTPVRTVNARRSLAQFWRRQVRWAQMRRRLRLDAYVVELALIPLVWLALCAMACASLYAERPLLALSLATTALLAWLSKARADLGLAARVHQALPLGRGLALVSLRELLMVGVWLEAFFKRSIDWRGNRFIIGSGSAIAPPRLAARALKVGG